MEISPHAVQHNTELGGVCVKFQHVHLIWAIKTPTRRLTLGPIVVLCPQGHYCPAGSPLALPCPTGEYQPNAGSHSCIPCRPGFYCEEAVVGDPWPCPPHSFCPAGMAVIGVSVVSLTNGTQAVDGKQGLLQSCCRLNRQSRW